MNNEILGIGGLVPVPTRINDVMQNTSNSKENVIKNICVSSGYENYRNAQSFSKAGDNKKTRLLRGV